MQPEENSCYEVLDKHRIQQGDIVRNLNISFSSQTDLGVYAHSPSFSYGVVLSQECDLEQHYNQVSDNDALVGDELPKHDKVVDMILICPAFASERFLDGNHIDGKNMRNFGNPKERQKNLEKLKKNDELNRYHFLPELTETLPELVIDFKRFYTVPIQLFEANLEDIYIASTKTLYKERISQRFTNYLSRIGLPDNRDS